MVRVVIAALLLTGCSSAPVIDFQESKEPKNMVRDEMECIYLADKTGAMFNWTRREYYKNCLDGRGYAIVNR